MLVKGRPEGSNITIMNSWYQYPKREEDTNGKAKYKPDTMTIIYKDNDTGEKFHEVIENPDYVYYEVNDNIKEEMRRTYNDDYIPLYMPKEYVHPVTVPYRNLMKDIAHRIGRDDYYQTHMRDHRALQELHVMTPFIFSSDVNINDHYRFRFGQEYTNEAKAVTKGYFDIEVDIKNMMGDFVQPGECPVNCCSYLDEKTQCVYTFVLRDDRNPLIQEFEDSVGPELYDELRNFVIESVGGWKQAKRFKIFDYKYKMMFFDSEMDMITTMFQLFHTIDPDFILAWNMAFDIPYIQARIEALGRDPKEVMCRPDFENKVCRYDIDEKNKAMFAKRRDSATISGHITWLDQMIQFAARRKGNDSRYPDFRLDTIGEMEAGVRKLDYSHITQDIGALPYLDFKTFVFYNVMDVVVQKCIEVKTGDIDYTFMTCNVNNTNYSMGHKQSVYLANRFLKEFYADGKILCNNPNRHNKKVGYPGAIVGRPENNDNFSKTELHGRIIDIVNNGIDFDYKALYPNDDLENNIAPDTLIGAIEMPKVYERENFYNNEKYSRSGEFIDNLNSDNIVEVSARYFKLAGYKEMLEDVIEYMRANGLESQLELNPLFIKSNYRLQDIFEVMDDGNIFEPQEVTGRTDYSEYKDAVTKQVAKGTNRNTNDYRKIMEEFGMGGKLCG